MVTTEATNEAIRFHGSVSGLFTSSAEDMEVVFASIEVVEVLLIHSVEKAFVVTFIEVWVRVGFHRSWLASNEVVEISLKLHHASDLQVTSFHARSLLRKLLAVAATVSRG